MSDKKVIHKRSNIINSDGSPKLPTTEQIDYGEIAINYGDGGEVISIKNSDNEIVAFIPKRAFVEAPIVTEDEVDYTLGILNGEIVRVAKPYLDIPEGDIVLDYEGNPVSLQVESNTSWDIN